jgi:hypothetical protein
VHLETSIQEHFQLPEYIILHQLLAKLRNVLGTIEPYSQVLGFVVYLKPSPPFSRKHQLLLSFWFLVIPKPPDSKSTLATIHFQISALFLDLHTPLRAHWQLSTFKFQLSSWTHVHPFKLKGGTYFGNVIH